MSEPESYFVHDSPARFVPTSHVGGAWNVEEQHIAPALGLLTHAIEADHVARRGRELRISRVTFDILGTLRIEPVEIGVTVLRPGRTIELVEARLSQDGRTAVTARAWLLQTYETEAFAGSAFPALPPRDAMPSWHPGDRWPGGFVRSLDVRRTEAEPGRAAFWLRPRMELVQGADVSPVARVLGMADVANGITPRVGPDVATFPNLDLTAHLLREPEGEWIGCDTTVSFGPRGAGMTHTVLHDAHGAFGTVVQSLTIRPR